MADTQAGPQEKKQRSNGARSREAILREAAQLATVEGIDGLSIGRLADAESPDWKAGDSRAAAVAGASLCQRCFQGDSF